MSWIESILGSLVAAAIAKVVKETSKRLADLKQRAQEIEDEQLRQVLQEEIEGMRRDLESAKEEIAKEIVKALAKPIEKSLNLNRIMLAFVEARTKCKPNMSVQLSQEISVRLGEHYIREAIERLCEPLSEGKDGGGTRHVAEINRLTGQLRDIYNVHQNHWDSGAVSSFLMVSGELAAMLDKVIKATIEHE